MCPDDVQRGTPIIISVKAQSFNFALTGVDSRVRPGTERPASLIATLMMVPSQLAVITHTAIDTGRSNPQSYFSHLVDE